MDNFDKRIKQIAKDENWEIPNEIDNNISKLLKNIEEPKTVRKRPLKVAILVNTYYNYGFCYSKHYRVL